jgi:RimJ/RimL family protein N-acetyltransferase
MAAADVDAVLDVQEPASVLALGTIFPQDEHPFPRAALRDRWLREIDDEQVDCFVVEHGDRVSGFVAVQGAELLHFGTAVETWGTGLAGSALDATLALWASRGVRSAWLRVFEANTRARRFYERHGWRATAERSRGNFPPYPVLLRYEIDVEERTADPPLR